MDEISSYIKVTHFFVRIKTEPSEREALAEHVSGEVFASFGSLDALGQENTFESNNCTCTDESTPLSYPLSTLKY